MNSNELPLFGTLIALRNDWEIVQAPSLEWDGDSRSTVNSVQFLEKRSTKRPPGVSVRFNRSIDYDVPSMRPRLGQVGSYEWD